jgi:hypothetical protein
MVRQKRNTGTKNVTITLPLNQAESVVSAQVSLALDVLSYVRQISGLTDEEIWKLRDDGKLWTAIRKR